MSRIASVIADSTTTPEVLVWPPKGPDEELDFILDWSSRLYEGDSIVEAVWTYAFTDNFVTGQSFTGDTTLVWLANGEVDRTYVLHCQVTTDNDRVLEQTVNITVRAR